jgi:hypothetical protein
LLFAVLAAAGSGLAIGLRFRVNMLFPASSVTAVGTIAAALLLRWSLSRTILMLVILLGAQQIGYLIGLLLAASGARSWSTHSREPETSDGLDRGGKPAKKH